MKVECVSDNICDLGESPLWNPELQKFFWADITAGQIWEYDPKTSSRNLFWEGEMMVGGFCFTKDGGLVICGDRGIHKLDPENFGDSNAPLRDIFDIQPPADERFNDITTDPMGRLFAGTLKKTRDNGVLYRLEKNKEPEIIFEGLGCSNGMTFSIDEKTFYHTDSWPRTIKAYDYDVDSGNISNPRIFAQFAKEDGMPDGITIDTEDHIWVAFWGGSVVRRVNPQGEVVEEIKFPARQITSVMFGGANLNELYATSAGCGCVDPKTGMNAKNELNGGPLYRFHSSKNGRAEWLADL